MYGVTYIWDGKNFIQFDKTQKHRRKKYKTVLVKQGINWDLIVQDKATEVTRTALIAWRGMSDYIKDFLHRTGKAYWLKGQSSSPAPKLKKGDNKVKDEHKVDAIFPPPQAKWETTTDLDWREVAESMNVNPDCGDESMVLTIIDILNCCAHHDIDDKKKRKEYGKFLLNTLKKNPKIVDDIYDIYFDGNYETEESAVQVPKCIVPLLQSMTADEDEDYDIAEQTVYGNSLEKLGIILEATPKILSGDAVLFNVEAERPELPQERDFYAGDDDRSQLALIPRDESGRFMAGNEAHLKRSKSMLTHVPKLACDTCYAADSCPYFKPKSVCYYDKELNKFDTRNLGDIIELASDITNMSAQRLFLARMFEQLDGGMPDKMVTDLINQVLGNLEFQRKLIMAQNPISGGSGQGHIQVTASGDAGNSILAKLFGGDMSGETPKEDKRKDVSPKENKTGSPVIDAEFFDVTDMDEDDVPFKGAEDVEKKKKTTKKKSAKVETSKKPLKKKKV